MSSEAVRSSAGENQEPCKNQPGVKEVPDSRAESASRLKIKKFLHKCSSVNMNSLQTERVSSFALFLCIENAESFYSII